MTTYMPRGVCARQIDVEVENGIITYVKFHGGCDGNHNGIEKLVVGMRAEDVIGRIEGVSCGGRPTSCPDQLAQALRKAMEE